MSEAKPAVDDGASKMTATEADPPGTIIVKKTLRSRVICLALTGIALSLIFNSQGYPALYDPLKACVGFSILAYLITVALIPVLGPEFVRVGFFGKDLGKKDRPVMYAL